MRFAPDSDVLTTIVESKEIYRRGALIYPATYTVYRAPKGSTASRPFRFFDTMQDALAAIGPSAVVVHTTTEPDSEGHTHTVFTF